MHPTTPPGPYEEADPLSDHLSTTLLPELEFTELPLDMVVECLRHLAGRALARSLYPTPGGFSIVLVASPERRAAPVSFKVSLGMTLEEALGMLAMQNGLDLVHCALGVVLCPPAVVESIQGASTGSEPAPAPRMPYHLFAREHWLRLIAYHPVLAVSNSPILREWVDALIASNDYTPKSAFELASTIVGKYPDDGCSPLTQIPHHLPRLTDGSIPGLD